MIPKAAHAEGRFAEGGSAEGRCAVRHCAEGRWRGRGEPAQPAC
jgi:hypothetical protein